MAILGKMSDLLADKGANRKAVADKKAEAKLAHLSQLNTRFSTSTTPTNTVERAKPAIEIIPIRTKAQLTEALRVLVERNYTVQEADSVDTLWETYGMRLQLILLNDSKKAQLLVTP